MTTPPQFTAAQIATVLGRPAFSIRRALEGVKADGRRVVRNKCAATYHLENLPANLRAQLQALATAQGRATPAALFVAPETWRPAVPWDKCSNEAQTAALRLQRALLPVLEVHRHPILDGSELIAIGLRHYAREFQEEISETKWRYLFNRTLDRDGGRHLFARPEIYLSGNLTSIPSEMPAAEFAPIAEEFRSLHAVLLGFSSATEPTADEKALLWKRSFEWLQSSGATGRQLKKAKARLLAFLWKHSRVSASFAGLRKALERAIHDGIRGAGAADAFADGREDRRGVATAPVYDPAQINLVKLAAAKFTGGHVVTAARELNAAGLITDPRIKQALDTAGSKSYLPTSLRAEFKDVEAWRIIGKGDRYARKLTPKRKLTYDGIFSMTCLVGDDKTPDLYVAVPDGKGWWTPMRAQWIVIIDYRTGFIVGDGLTPNPQYKVMDFYAPFKRIFKRYGLPKFILREGGMWRKSLLANSLADIGKGTAERNLNRFSPAQIEFGLERKGLRFLDAAAQLEENLGEVGIKFRESFQANSKPVEGTMRLLTQYMERLPCYCGRREMDDCPTATRDAVAAVKARKASPHEVNMLVWDQWVDTAAALKTKLNNEKQEGRKLCHPLTGAPMSPSEGFDVFQNRNDPPSPFDDQCEVLLSHIQAEVTVKAPDLRRKQFPCGFVEFRGHTYCSEETGNRIGQKFLAHWDPEFPETITLTDMKLRHPFTVPLLKPNNALLPDPQMELTTAQANRTIAAPRAVYRATEAAFEIVVRRALVDPLVKTLNAHVKQEAQAATERKQNDSRKRSRINSIGAKLGHSVAAVARDADARLDEIEAGAARRLRARQAAAKEEAATPTREVDETSTKGEK